MLDPFFSWVYIPATVLKVDANDLLHCQHRPSRHRRDSLAVVWGRATSMKLHFKSNWPTTSLIPFCNDQSDGTKLEIFIATGVKLRQLESTIGKEISKRC